MFTIDNKLNNSVINNYNNKMIEFIYNEKLNIFILILLINLSD